MKHKTTVLLVEHDPAMAAMLAEHLRRRGFEAHHVDCMDDALSAVNARGFDSVLAEMSLERTMDGLELCTRVHASRPELPVILTTPFGDRSTKNAALRAGACDFVAKPFELEELDARLRRALAQSPLRRAVEPNC